LGVSVVVLPRHNPIHLAKQAADIDQMSGGRLILGVGLGANADDLLQYGLSPERRVARFLESVRILRALWTQHGVDLKGDFYELKGANIEPKPAQGSIPLWFGANVEAAIRRAVKHADGWTGAGSSVLDALRGNIALVQELLAADGRTQADFPISKRMYLAVDDDEAHALRRLKEWSSAYYGSDAMPERSAIWGSPAKIQEKLAEMAEMGVNEFVLNPVFDYEDQLEKLAQITGLV
jgi:probable F420-dependent oxidoreductase